MSKWVNRYRSLRTENRSMSASLIGHSRSSAFRLSAGCGVDVTHGLVLLFGIGTKALVRSFRYQGIC